VNAPIAANLWLSTRKKFFETRKCSSPLASDGSFSALFADNLLHAFARIQNPAGNGAS